MGFRSGEYFGRKNSLAPAERMSWRTALPLWLPRLSMMTMSPGFKVGDEDLLDLGPEAVPVDRAVEHPWSLDPVVAQGGQEGRGPPPAVRDLGGKPHAAGRPSPQRRHVGLGPGLVDEDQALRLDPALILGPLRPPTGDVGTIALAGRDAFF